MTILPATGKCSTKRWKCRRARALVRRFEHHHLADPLVKAFGDTTRRAALAGRPQPLQDHDQAQLLAHQPGLELEEVDLQPTQFPPVRLFAQLSRTRLRRILVTLPAILG